MEEIQRPQAGTRKIHSKNQFEFCYLRHRYLRQVKHNPTSEEMAPYKPIIQQLSHRTYYTYSKLFHIVGMVFDDILAIGNVHLVNFIGLFEIGPNKNVAKYNKFVEQIESKNNAKITNSEILNKNKAILTLFIKQRMDDLVRICKQKAKNIRGLRVDEFAVFYGSQPPPDDLRKLLKDNAAFGYRKCDPRLFRAYRKKVKAKVNEVFKFAGNWYVTVPLPQRPLTWNDLIGAGLNPYENEHNLNPEQLLIQRHEEIRIDKKIKMFKTSSREDKAKTIIDFVEKNANNPNYKDEIITARKMLRNLGHIDVG